MSQDELYDYIIAGGGLAGLSLACAMVHSGLRERRILVVEQVPEKGNDRTWGFWTRRRTRFDAAISHTWERMRVSGEGFDRVLDLGDYRYAVIRGDDFYALARRELEAAPAVRILNGTVERIEDGQERATVIVDGQPIYARWVFDSVPAAPRTEGGEFQWIRMHFRGWEIETERAVFDPRTLTFLDFRTPQLGEMRFFYVLPFTAQRALVEFTVFSRDVLNREAYEQALRDYLGGTLGVTDYRLLSEERGSVLITDDPLRRVLGRRVMAIGARAGRVKPSTGYAFMRVQQDSDEIVQSLLLYGHPFSVPDDPDLYDVLDAVMLRVIDSHGDAIKPAFSEMFRRNPVRSILSFLDEQSSPWEALALIASMPTGVFLKAFVQVVARENLFDIMEG